MVEGARLESVYTAKPYRGFEPLPLRQILVELNDLDNKLYGDFVLLSCINLVQLD